MLNVYIQGFLISIGLIVAIGAQNAYVLKRGLLKESVFLVALTCSLIDATLIYSGVKGVGKFVESYPQFIIYITWLGIVFLLAYGLLALKSVFSKHILKVDTHSSKKSSMRIFITLLSLSFLNPHVYLDTLLLIGTIGSSYKGINQDVFAFGAMSASFVWFFALGYGSRVLIPLFKRPITWKYLDFITAIVMFIVAYKFYTNL